MNDLKKKTNYLHGAVALFGLICSAYLAFDFNISDINIPFTAQSLAVFVIAAFLKPSQFLMVICSYLAMGILGLPVFAEGSAGWSKLMGGSGGFLYGFIFSGWFISFACRKVSPKWLNLIFIMLLGTLILFFFGIGHLILLYGFEKALEYGLYPYWKMALVKATLAAFLVNVCQLIYLKTNK